MKPFIEAAEPPPVWRSVARRGRERLLRDLLGHGWGLGKQGTAVLVSYAASTCLPAALESQRQLHQQGVMAELHPEPLFSQQQADAIATARGCSRALWLTS